MELIDTSYTKETGEIRYYIVAQNVCFDIRIEQERGILTAAQTSGFSESFSETAKFIRKLAGGKVTAASLYSLCDDYHELCGR